MKAVQFELRRRNPNEEHSPIDLLSRFDKQPFGITKTYRKDEQDNYINRAITDSLYMAINFRHNYNNDFVTLTLFDDLHSTGLKSVTIEIK